MRVYTSALISFSQPQCGQAPLAHFTDEEIETWIVQVMCSQSCLTWHILYLQVEWFFPWVNIPSAYPARNSSPSGELDFAPSPAWEQCLLSLLSGASPALSLARSLPPSLSLGQMLSFLPSCGSSLWPVISPLAWFEMIWVPPALEPAPVSPFRQVCNPGHGVQPSAVCSCSPHPQRTNASCPHRGSPGCFPRHMAGCGSRNSNSRCWSSFWL